MKILRVSFKNLNSLPSGDVNLECGPLANAGIFAITGPTGAGKSTILDAITLALYGRAARYGTESNPENMMSRHTGECQAEVFFEVPRGRFSARWELRRARKKSDGKVQSARRTVMNVDGVTLAERVNDADRGIEDLTGLDYPRFLRSVLLAQGEFAQFLRADKDDRAALLESLTGTQIYSELGILAHEEFARRDDALARREGDLGRIVLLSSEEREVKSADIERLSGEIATLGGERDALARRVQLGIQLVEFSKTELEIGRKQTALVDARERSVPELERLARHRLAQPFLRDLDLLDELQRKTASEAVALDNARAAVTTARKQLAAGIQVAAALGMDLVSSADEAISEGGGTVDKLTRTLADLDEWLATHVADQGLGDAFAGLAEQIVALTGARARHGAALVENRKCAGEREQSVGRLQRLQSALETALRVELEAKASVCAADKALETLLEGRTSDSVHKALSDLNRQRAALVELQGVGEQRTAAEKDAAALAATIVEETTTRDAALAEKDRLLREANACHERLELTREKVELLRRIASLEDQRHALESGKPCPLCGALEHPFTAGEPSPGDLRDAEQAFIKAKAAHAKAGKDLKIAEEALARAEQGLVGSAKRRAEAGRILATVVERFATLGDALGVGSLEGLEGRLGETVKARESLEALTVSIRQAEQAKSAAELTHAKQQTTLAATREKIEAEQKVIAAVEERILLIGTAVSDSEKQVGEAGALLALGLVPFDLALPAPGLEQGTRQALDARRCAWRDRTTERQRVEAARNQESAALAELDRKAVEIRRQVRKLADSGAGFDFANTAPDRTEITRLRREWRTLDEAGQGLDRFRSNLTATVAALEERRKEYEGVEAAARRHAADLSVRLQATQELPFADAESLRAVRLPDAETTRIAEVQAGLDRQASALAAQLEQVLVQCATAREGGAPEADEIPALESERQKQHEVLERASESRTTLRNELARDDENRQAREAQGRAVEEERVRLAVWARMRQLIGSHDGAKFRQFAQGLSLDVLVRHANCHLKRLSERYGLRRTDDGELMLEIVDLHQAGASRPMLSLSGGESFLASLALALGLSDLAGRNVRIDSLFIDEGFGSLDAETLDTAVAALDVLRLGNKTVGVISHVELLKERIPVQIRIEKLAGGISVLRMPEDA